jgi:hypothetical protein
MEDILNGGTWKRAWFDRMTKTANEHRAKLNRAEALKEGVRDGKVVVLFNRLFKRGPR